jgi:hypothetical protein
MLFICRANTGTEKEKRETSGRNGSICCALRLLRVAHNDKRFVFPSRQKRAKETDAYNAI